MYLACQRILGPGRVCLGLVEESVLLQGLRLGKRLLGDGGVALELLRGFSRHGAWTPSGRTLRPCLIDEPLLAIWGFPSIRSSKLNPDIL